MSRKSGEFGDVVRLKPYQYIHVHDNNTNVAKIVSGPVTFTKQDHEQILTSPQQFIVIPPRHYCYIENPVQRDESGNPVRNKFGETKVRLGDREIRFEQAPFPLFPQEQLVDQQVQPLRVLKESTALRLKALRDFDDRQAGDEWLFEGPGTYIPRIEEEICEEVSATVLKPNTALLLRARSACVDRQGTRRAAGEEWLLRAEGSYLPGVEEEITAVVEAKVLTDTKALHLEALRTFTDVFGQVRKAGDQWLVTKQHSETYISGPNEKIRGTVPLTILGANQFAVVQDPVKKGKQMLGQKEVRRGCCTFFLHPGESLESGIEDVFVLGEEEALLLSANEAFVDGDVTRNPGDRWMIYGPREFVPKVAEDVLEKRKNIPLDENEGIYVRDTKSGQVRAVIGKTYMLEPDEELWSKEISPQVEKLLGVKNRDPRKIVTYSVPHNSVAQVYDYKSKASRICFGPDLVKLGPDEEFTVRSLSGGKPKKANQIPTLSISMGPDFMTDVVVVETSDHARLALQLSYNWHFECKSGDFAAAKKIFNVSDFVGDACSALASRIRGAVAAEPFDLFHKNSTNIIRAATFGVEKVGEEKRVRESMHFKNNGLVITSVDIQSVEPVDAKTRDALVKSVQLAIEITTKSQEASARHDAERREQVAKGELERQKISDKALAEKERMVLLGLQAEAAAIESTGSSKAEAKAHAAAAAIDGESQVSMARLRGDALKISSEAHLTADLEKQKAELQFKEDMDNLEIVKAKEMSEIEVNKFRSSVTAMGRDTIAAMARAGPEMQAKLLKGLGLQGYLMTDGSSPINLMNAANSLVGGESQ